MNVGFAEKSDNVPTSTRQRRSVWSPDVGFFPGNVSVMSGLLIQPDNNKLNIKNSLELVAKLKGAKEKTG